MAQARRIYLYVMAFAGLLTLLMAVTGLIALVISTLWLPASVVAPASEVRQRASLYLAAIIIGLPVWLGHWWPAERLAARSEEERQSFMRRLFMAAIFATTAIVALYGLRGSLVYLLTFPGVSARQTSSQAGIQALVKFVVYGVAWLSYLRIGQDRELREHDRLHDLGVYVVSGFALGFLVWGVGQAIGEIVRDLTIGVGASGRLLLAPEHLSWTIWASISSWLLAGGVIWGAIWSYDLARGGRRQWRVIYLYVVLIVSAPATLGGATYGLYELLRRAFGLRPEIGGWDFLQDALPVMLSGGVACLYHWSVVRQQTSLAVEGSSGLGVEEVSARGIAWPRRPALALLALLGVAATASAFVGLLWVALDFAFNAPVTLSTAAWWRDRMSLSLAAGALGTAVWLVPWLRLEHAAQQSPKVERGSLVRRAYLGFIVLGGALTALGFLVALLWLVFRLLLGDPVSAANVSSLFKDFSAALVAAALSAYHALALRHDLGGQLVMRERTRLLVLMEPGAEGALERLRSESKADIRVLGRMTPTAAGLKVNSADLPGLLTRQEAPRPGDGELIVLGPSEAVVYTYQSGRTAAKPAGPQ